MPEQHREAQLKRMAADRHLLIPVRMWTSATRMTDLVLAERRRTGKALSFKERPLAETDFAFRGGHQSNHRGLHTRVTDAKEQGPSLL